MPSALSSESARERELYRYYQPSIFAQHETDINHQRPAESSQDRTLTAFAQLACLRMKTKRAMISFVDRKYEYIAAEATRTLSLLSDVVHDEEDHLLIGSRTIPKEEGICSVAVDAFISRSSQKHQSDGNAQTVAMVINDLSEDEKFATRKFTVAESKLGFYASVALRSPLGFIIGAFSVVDDAPRPGITLAEEQFLKDMADTVIEHLEIASAKRKRSRAENMIKAMGLFVEGKDSLRDWWLHTGHMQYGRQTGDRVHSNPSLEQQADEEFGTVQLSSLNNYLKDATDTALQVQPQTVPTLSGDYPADAKNLKQPTRSFPRRQNSLTSTSYAQSDHSQIALHTSAMTTPDSREPGSASDPGSEQSSVPLWDDSGPATSAQLHQTVPLKDVTDVFSRASNLLREATGVEGVAFFDATIGNLGGGSNPKVPTAFRRETENWTSSSSDDEQRLAREKHANIDRSNPSESLNRSSLSSPATPDASKYCDIIGYSTRSQSSLYSQAPSHPQLLMSQKFLQKLLKRYPHGKVFNFNEDCSISSSEDDPDDVKKPSVSMAGDDGGQARLGSRREIKKKQKIMEAETVLKMLPGARSVAFMPIWDSHKEKWYAGSLSWTTVSTRVFDAEEDLTYLAAFGNSIMAEISRINALISDQTKSEFLGSISHELRSPLHGVLASVEFLQDTQMTSLQQSMVSSIETCGKALLDVIDHALDFVKVNTYNKARRASKKLGISRSKTWAASPTARIFPEDLQVPKVNLSTVVEEVMENFIADRRYTHSSTNDSFYYDHTINFYNGNYKESKISYGEAQSDPSVMVILDVDWQSNWSFDIQAGAWRRIVMNLVSNAMRYTSQGLVYVSLRSDNSAISKPRGLQSVIKLTIEDSGRGMSEEFLRNHIFQPFSQESNLTTGTGLGLSIVRQTLDGLGGSIDINSEQGAGTKAVVSLTLDQPLAEDGSMSKREDLIINVKKKTATLRLCLVGFDLHPNVGDVPDGMLPVEAKSMSMLKSSISRLAAHWFNMDVVFTQAPHDVAADIYVAVERVVNSWSTESIHFKQAMLPGSPGGKPLIVIGSHPSSADNTILNNAQRVIYISPPYGPYGMAKALDFCMTRLEALEPAVTDDKRLLEKNVLMQNNSPHENNVSNAHVDPRAYNSVVNQFNDDGPLLNSMDHMHSVELKDSDHPQVLLVEDNEINLKLLVTYMRKIQVAFGTAVNGLLALNAYQKMDPVYDVILMDISMPVMDGLTAAREIRRFEHERSLRPSKIIALTGAASPSSRQEAYRSGIDLFLTKPVPMRDLKRLLDKGMVK